jgi:hypothetical protein
MSEKTPPRQSILEATVTCIEKYGVDNAKVFFLGME